MDILILINFHTLFSIGGSYAFKLSSELQNPFWKDLMDIWAEFCKILPVENIGQILDSPLWHNENIGRVTIFKKNWHENGIRVVYDIIGQNGEIIRLNNFKQCTILMVLFRVSISFKQNTPIMNNPN